MWRHATLEVLAAILWAQEERQCENGRDSGEKRWKLETGKRCGVQTLPGNGQLDEPLLAPPPHTHTSLSLPLSKFGLSFLLFETKDTFNDETALLFNVSPRIPGLPLTSRGTWDFSVGYSFLIPNAWRLDLLTITFRSKYRWYPWTRPQTHIKV